MDISTYFNQIQEYIKNNIQNPSELDSIIKELDKDNIQLVVNQDFNNNISIEECADKLLKAIDNTVIDEDQPNQINGERTLNKMERKIMKYSEFVNEHNEWQPTSKYDSNVIYGDDIKDENAIMQFIEYNNINPLVGDIWKYAKDLGRYPDKMSNRAMKYSSRGSTKVEIEFGEKIYLWHFRLHYIPSEYRFDNKLIKQCNFTYKEFKEMLGVEERITNEKYYKP